MNLDVELAWHDEILLDFKFRLWLVIRPREYNRISMDYGVRESEKGEEDVWQ